MSKAYRVCYNPNHPLPVNGRHVLSELDDRNEAIETAIADSRIWGPTWVEQGRKIVFRSNA